MQGLRIKGQGERVKGKAKTQYAENVGANGLSMSRNDSFENLVVWKKAMDLVVKVYQLCQQCPLSKDWGMRDQLQRAAVSIPANIAEGYERGGRKEYIRYLTISKGSSGELRCLLTVAWQLKYFSKEVGVDVINDAVEVSKMLKGLINSLSPDRD